MAFVITRTDFLYESPIVEIFLITVKQFLKGRSILSFVKEEDNLRFYVGLGYKDLKEFFTERNVWSSINTIDNDLSNKLLSIFLNDKDNFDLFLKQYNALNLEVFDIDNKSENLIKDHIKDQSLLIDFFMHYKNAELSRSKLNDTDFINNLNSILIGTKEQNISILHNVVKNEKVFFEKPSNKLMLKSYLVDNVEDPEQFKAYYDIGYKSEKIKDSLYTYNIYINKIDLMNTYMLKGRYEIADYEQMLTYIDNMISDKLSVKTGMLRLNNENVLLTIISDAEIKIDLDKLYHNTFKKYVSTIKDENIPLAQTLSKYLDSVILKEKLSLNLSIPSANMNKKKI